jgi:hypothetical protein
VDMRGAQMRCAAVLWRQQPAARAHAFPAYNSVVCGAPVCRFAL